MAPSKNYFIKTEFLNLKKDHQVLQTINFKRNSIRNCSMTLPVNYKNLKLALKFSFFNRRCTDLNNDIWSKYVKIYHAGTTPCWKLKPTSTCVAYNWAINWQLRYLCSTPRLVTSFNIFTGFNINIWIGRLFIRNNNIKSKFSNYYSYSKELIEKILIEFLLKIKVFHGRKKKKPVRSE